MTAKLFSFFHFRQIPLAIFILWSSVIILIVGSGIVLTGWMLDNATLTTIVPGYPSMKANTAFGLLLLGIGLIANTNSKTVLISRVAGLCLVGFFAATLVEYYFNIDLGIDQLLVTDRDSMMYPGRPSQATAFSLLFGGLLLSLSTRFVKHYPRLFYILLLIGMLGPLLVFTAYLIDPPQLFAIDFFSTMAIHTAIGLSLYYLAASVSFRTGYDFLLCTSQLRGSRQFRRLILPTVGFPIVLGWIIERLVSYDVIHPNFGIAMFATGFVVISPLALARNSLREDLKYNQLNTENAEVQMQLSIALDAVMGAIFLFSESGKVRSVNHGASRVFGWSYEEMLNMSLNDFVPPRLRENHREHVKNFTSSHDVAQLNSNPLKMVGYTKDGIEIPILVTIAKNRLNGETVFGAVILEAKNISDQMHKLQNEALVDPLSNVYNRRSFDNSLNQISLYGLRREHEIAVLMLDIDHFKQINDTYGHEIGDMVISEFATRARDSLRNTDKIFRYGGDEFVVLAQCNDINHAHNLAERIRDSIESSPVSRDECHISITCSIGVCTLDKHGTDIKSCLKNADQALFQAKQLGRNQAILHVDGKQIPYSGA